MSAGCEGGCNDSRVLRRNTLIRLWGGSGCWIDQTPGGLQPALVLVLGHVAARAALGRTEPLGRLRAVPHTVAGRPAVVTYDPAFLLRSQDAKAATWADLCRALALVRKAEGGTSHAG